MWQCSSCDLVFCKPDHLSWRITHLQLGGFLRSSWWTSYEFLSRYPLSGCPEQIWHPRPSEPESQAFQRINPAPLNLDKHGMLEWRRWANHLQGSSEDTTEQVGVDECVVVIRQLHKVDQRVVLQDEGEFISGRAPVGHTGGDSQVHLKCILPSTTIRRALKWTENHAGSNLWLNYVLSVKVLRLVISVDSNRKLPLQSHQLFLGNPGSGRRWSVPESPRSGALRCCNPWKREQKRGKDYCRKR